MISTRGLCEAGGSQAPDRAVEMGFIITSRVHTGSLRIPGGKSKETVRQGPALNTVTARFIQVLSGSFEALASVLTTPYMFTQTHRVNTHLNMVKKKKKKSSNQTKIGPEMKK